MARVSIETLAAMDFSSAVGILVSVSRAGAAATCVAALSARHLTIGASSVASMMARIFVM
eukprot:7501302-Pyramimonas_sp.AAC.1